MKVSIAQTEIIPGQPQENFLRMKARLMEAQDQGADLVVFPEMCLSGYLIGDLWEEEAFVSDCEYWGDEFAKLSNSTAVVFGNVGLDRTRLGEDGRPRKYNAAFVAQNGELIKHPTLGLKFFPKTLMPNYRQFEESRHFYDLRKLAIEDGRNFKALFNPVSIATDSGNKKLGLVVCEDSWNGNYGFSPMETLVGKGAELLVNISSSPYTRGKAVRRRQLFSEVAKKLQVSVVFVNNTGLQNNGKTLFTFDGRSSIFNHDGELILRLPAFEARCMSMEIDTDEERISEVMLSEGIESIYNALKLGISSFAAQSGLRRFVIGVSGGVDSAVVAGLFASIFRPEQILLVNMPSKYNSDTTINASRELAKNLGCWYCEVPISESVDLTTRQIDGLVIKSNRGEQTLNLTDFHLENVQARDRSSRILAALSSAFGGVFTCNANKAEMTVGYSTLYGDHGGFMAPIGDLWKEEVYELGRYLNEEIFFRQVIPKTIFEIPPSAELSGAQDVDAGQGDPLHYWYHDRLFATWVETWNKLGPEHLLKMYKDRTICDELGLDEKRFYNIFSSVKDFIEDLEKWWKAYKGMGVVKRIQAPPVLAVSRRAFGFDHREAIQSVFWSKRYLELREELLKAKSI